MRLTPGDMMEKNSQRYTHFTVYIICCLDNSAIWVPSPQWVEIVRNVEFPIPRAFIKQPRIIHCEPPDDFPPDIVSGTNNTDSNAGKKPGEDQHSGPHVRWPGHEHCEQSFDPTKEEDREEQVRWNLYRTIKDIENYGITGRTGCTP